MGIWEITIQCKNVLWGSQGKGRCGSQRPKTRMTEQPRVLARGTLHTRAQMCALPVRSPRCDSCD